MSDQNLPDEPRRPSDGTPIDRQINVEIEREAARLVRLGMPKGDALLQARQRIALRRREERAQETDMSRQGQQYTCNISGRSAKMICAPSQTFSISHLSAATGHPRFMAVFVAYFDAGGSTEDPNSRIISIAGWIATEARWRRLEKAWRTICDHEGVSGLHMKDFAHSRGEFQGWAGDETRRQRFLADLAAAIHRHTNRDFSCSLFLDGYRAVDEQYKFHEHVGHPYMIGGWACIQSVREWMAKTHPDDLTLFVFEKGDAHQSELLGLLKRDGIDLGHDPIFMKKRWKEGGKSYTSPALECADYLAYEHVKNLTDIINGKRTKARGSLGLLAKYFNQPARRWRMLDGRFFDKVRQIRNVPRRPNVPERPIPYEMDQLAQALKDKFHIIPRHVDYPKG